MNLDDIRLGDLFEEHPHYTVTKINSDSITFLHLESGQEVVLSKGYVKDLLNTADQYEEEIHVTREDKRDGTPGIRTIFSTIQAGRIFSVRYKKKDEPKTKKALAAEKEAQRTAAIELIEKAKKSKKSMAKAYEEALTYIQENPILEYVPGDGRTLRGYKLSNDLPANGLYSCRDVDTPVTDKDPGIRLVNINTISKLVFDNKCYIVDIK